MPNFVTLKVARLRMGVEGKGPCSYARCDQGSDFVIRRIFDERKRETKFYGACHSHLGEVTKEVISVEA